MSQASLLQSEALPQVQIVNQEPTTTSLNVAQVFDKPHADVLKSVRSLIKETSQDLREGNFDLSSYEVVTGNGTKKKFPMYILTQDAFTLLVMGFTGTKALQFKIAYMNEFKRMREELEHKARFTPLQEAIPEYTSTEDRKSMRELVNVWARLTTMHYSDCYRVIRAHFKVARIDKLTKDMMPSVMEFVQGKIDEVQLAIEPKQTQQQLALEQCDDLILDDEFDDDKYMKMIGDLFQKIETVKFHISFYGRCARKVNLSPEMLALYKSAEDSSKMATCGLAMAQYALQNAIRIKAKFDFVQGRALKV